MLCCLDNLMTFHSLLSALQRFSHILLLLDRVVITVICIYVCSATVFVATATISMGHVLRLLLLLELL